MTDYSIPVWWTIIISVSETILSRAIISIRAGVTCPQTLRKMTGPTVVCKSKLDTIVWNTIAKEPGKTNQVLDPRTFQVRRGDPHR